MLGESRQVTHNCSTNMEAPIVQVTGSVEMQIPLPVMPLYDIKLAAQLIPCKFVTLMRYLQRHKQHFPAIYRRAGHPRRIRMLTAPQIQRIRAGMLKGPGLAATLVTVPLVSITTDQPHT